MSSRFTAAGDTDVPWLPLSDRHGPSGSLALSRPLEAAVHHDLRRVHLDGRAVLLDRDLEESVLEVLLGVAPDDPVGAGRVDDGVVRLRRAAAPAGEGVGHCEEGVNHCVEVDEEGEARAWMRRG